MPAPDGTDLFPAPMTRNSLSTMLFTSPGAQRLWRFAMLACLLFSAAMALSPNPPVQVDTGWDKSNHALSFSALAFTGLLGFPPTRSWLAWLAAGLLAFGGLIELAQLHIPGRQGDWADLVADAAGITLGLVFACLLRRLIRFER
jgi:VanZ family protein